ncbi:hypothetical protein K1719_015032 [Acacia pycnantha]|nr:hypothetical protein K1719_015032 [Acacia pycnantha]
MAPGEYSIIDNKRSSSSYWSTVIVVTFVGLCLVGIWMMTLMLHLDFRTCRVKAGSVFVVMISFQIMHEFGVSVPLDLVELKACNEALHIVHLAQDRNM